MPTALGRVASGPGAWHQSPTGRGSPGLREAARASALAPGRGRRRQAQISHEWSGVIDAGQVAACRDGRDRPRPRHATAGWQRLNDRAEPPRGARLRACRCQAREPVRVCGARPAIVLADAWRGGGGPDDRAPPAPVRRTPRGAAGRAAIRPPQHGVAAARGRLESVPRLCPRTAQVTPRCVWSRWDRDGREVPGAHEARHWDGLTTSRVDPVTGLLRDHGRGDDPAAGALWGQLAREPRAAGAGFRDPDERRALGPQVPEALVESTLPGPDRAPSADFRAICLGDRSDRHGLVMAIQSDGERARLSHGGPPSVLG